MIDFLKKIVNTLKKIFQSADRNNDKSTIEIKQNKNSGTITNNIGSQVHVEDHCLIFEDLVKTEEN